MKKLIVPIFIGVVSLVLLNGCADQAIEGVSTTKPESATLGQQLMDLQKARDAGAITEAEYQSQKMKLLSK